MMFRPGRNLASAKRGWMSVDENSGSSVADGLTASNSKDLSLRGKGAADLATGKSAVSPRRARKGSPKPWWLTVICILARNIISVHVLLGLIYLVRQVCLQSYSFSDMEEQIAELSKRIEDRRAVLESELEKLEAKSETLEFMSEKLERCRQRLSGEEHKNWDGVTREEMKSFVFQEIEKHAADGLARPDYAAAASGAFVLRHSELLPIAQKTRNWKEGVHPAAALMLKPSFGERGECFPLKGSRGFVEIQLSASIIPEAVTLEHVAKSVSPDRSSAPKDCTLYGWFSGDSGWRPKVSLLAEFTYDLEKSNVQTFHLSDSTKSPGVIDTVRLDFSSNHGHPLYTCIYRLRVHGHEPDS